jgi:hypothetical protein
MLYLATRAATASILDELGIERFEARVLSLADGSQREFSLGMLLGATALEAYGLAADAKNKKLIPGELTL